MNVTQHHRQMVQFWAAKNGISDLGKLSYAQELAAVAATGLPSALIAAVKDGRTEFEPLDTRLAQAQLAVQTGERFTPVASGGGVYDTKTSTTRPEFDALVATFTRPGHSPSQTELSMIGEALSGLQVTEQSAALDALFSSGSTRAFSAAARGRDPNAHVSAEAFSQRVKRDETPQDPWGPGTRLAGFSVVRGQGGAPDRTVRSEGFAPVPQPTAVDPESYGLAFAALSDQDRARPELAKFAAL